MKDHDWQLNTNSTAVAEKWKLLPAPSFGGLNSPEDYKPQQNSVDAANLALALGQPLLVTGEPGCGKTVFADWVALQLGLRQALRFQTRSTSVARDLFYGFDAVGRFHAAQTGRDVDPRNFVTFRAFGEAILRAKGRTEIAEFVSPARLELYPEMPIRSVVLIDEIDKASRDFPNDVLAELDRYSTEVPELAKELAAPIERLPIVIITSNAERSLPDAFLRRCLFHHMSFPSEARLKEIVSARIAGIQPSALLLQDAIELVLGLRAKRTVIGKPPGTSELLAFILSLKMLNYGPNDSLKNDERWFPAAKTTLVKSADRIAAADAMFKAFA